MTKYTPSHEWINVDGNIATVGITAFAQKELGEVVYAELPSVGADVQAGQPIVVLESTKAAVDIYTPVSGTILAVNNNLKSSPQLVNSDAEGSGWLLKIDLSHPEEMKSFMDKSAYNAYINKH